MVFFSCFSWVSCKGHEKKEPSISKIDVQIHFSLKDKSNASQGILVKTSFVSNTKNTPLLMPTQFGFGKDLRDEIKNLTAFDENRGHLKIKPYRDENGKESPHLVIIKHKANEKVFFEYVLSDAKSSKFWKSTILNDKIFFRGNMLVLPHGKIEKFEISWNLDASSWTFINPSISADSKHSIQDQIFGASKTATTYNFNLKDASVSVIVDGNWPNISTFDLAKRTEESFKSLENYFDGHAFKKYVLYITDEASWLSGTNGFLGTCHQGSLVFALGKNLTLDNIKVLHGLTHEIAHFWNGKAFRWNERDFNEGFTDFIALQALLRSKLITENDYLKFINDILGEYYVSNVKHVGQSAVDEGYFDNPSFFHIPYYRGFLFAILVDLELKENNYSLRQILVSFFQKAQETHETVYYNIKQLVTEADKYNSGQYASVRYKKTIELAVFPDFNFVSGKTLQCLAKHTYGGSINIADNLIPGGLFLQREEIFYRERDIKYTEQAGVINSKKGILLATNPKPIILTKDPLSSKYFAYYAEKRKKHPDQYKYKSTDQSIFTGINILEIPQICPAIENYHWDTDPNGCTALLQ